MTWKDTSEAPPPSWPWARELKQNIKSKGPTKDDAAAIQKAHELILELDGKGIEGKSVLDYGCGRGVCLKMAAKMNAGELWAVDLLEDALLLTARNLQPRNVKAVRLHGEKLPLTNNTVDIVWSHGVVEHMAPEALRVYFSESVRVAKEYVVFSAPNPNNGPYQDFRTMHLANKTWIWGYEEPEESYAHYMRDLGCEIVYDGDAGTDEETALMYAAHLKDGRRRQHWVSAWKQGKVAGTCTLVVAKPRRG